MTEWIGAIAGAVAATVAVIGLLVGRHHRVSSPGPGDPAQRVPGQPVEPLGSIPRQREKASPFWIPFLVVHALLLWRVVAVYSARTDTANEPAPDLLIAFLALAATTATLPIFARVWRTKRIVTALVAVLLVVPLLAFDVLMLVGTVISIST